MSLRDLTHDSVTRAIAEFDQLGRELFLRRYRFGKARSFFLVHVGQFYDSKAIAGAAHGFATGTPLKAADFNGGEAAAAGRLRALGFSVVDVASVPIAELTSSEPLVLVENEITANARYDDWKDVTGERYHFPNQYRNRFWEGRKFMYDRGARRAGNERGTPEYFGIGTIGEVFRDPDTGDDTPAPQRHWFAEVIDYRPFPRTVPAKLNGEYLEQIPQNFWGVGVRVMPLNTYRRVLELAQLQDENLLEPKPRSSSPIDPEIVPPREQLFVPRMRRIRVGGSGGYRRSRRSKTIGDRAEQVVFEMLSSTLSLDCVRHCGGWRGKPSSPDGTFSLAQAMT